MPNTVPAFAAPSRFGGANSAARIEDAPLLTGAGHFTADIALPGQTHAVFVRAAQAHACIRSIDTDAARAMPGVLAAIAGRDLAAEGIGAIPPALTPPGRGGKPMVSAAMPVLAVDRVRYAGEPVAVVVAETLAQALDAAEAINVVLDALPVAADVRAAMAPDAAALFADAPGNIAFDWEDGDIDAVSAAFATAAHVETIVLEDPRLAPAAMEPRAAIGAYDPETGRMTLIAPTQGVSIVHRTLATAVFNVPPESIRVLTHDVGGGFGMKSQTYPEYAAVMFAARQIGRPVKWTATRLESFLGDTAGRDGVLEGELALDANGRFLALRARTFVGLGAYTTAFAAIFTTSNTRNCLSSVYVIPSIHVAVKSVLTNNAPLGPYRGAGRPEAIYLIERLIDAAARSMNIDRADLRRRNLIQPAAMPYRTPNGPIYDSGDFPAVLDKALAASGWAGFPARRSISEQGGRLRGIGVCCFLEVAGGILDETVDLRFDADGTVALRTGAQAMGQGHLSTFPPLIAGLLGIDPARVRLIQGDSDEVPGGTPSVASRSVMMVGSAAKLACDQALEKGRHAAAELLEAAVADVVFAGGVFRIVGTDRTIPILEVAGASGGLDSVARFDSPQMTFPNGCHVCEVEIEPDTGTVRVVRYTAVDDVGNALNETIVEGQIHGGVAQGLGQVLGERVVYADDGQLVTGSFMDYAMPRADEMPAMQVLHHPVPATTNPLGVKGAGESGVAGALPSGVAAVLDALASRGVAHLDLPMTAERVWAALLARG